VISRVLTLNVCVILMFLILPAILVAQSGEDDLDCSNCHACLNPSRIHPCLKTMCPRHEAMTNLPADMGPDIVVLDELESLYEPVVFDHKAHAEMVRFSGGCETCHHYTPPNSEHPACSSCHPGEIEHEDIAQPGLKGAYHRDCLDCHQEWDKDTACEICHEKKQAHGPPPDLTAVHRHYEPVVLEDLLIFETGFEEGDRVPFHHKNHSELYGCDCALCHQEQSCGRCHVHGEVLHPMGEPAETDLHETCYVCHGEQGCGECHGRDPDDLFQHVSTGWPLESYHQKLKCRACHGHRGPFMKLESRCENCHPGGWPPETFNHLVTGAALDELHLEAECADCHVDGVGSAASCDLCHDDGRVYGGGVVGFTPEE